jgi:hypothetical protein
MNEYINKQEAIEAFSDMSDGTPITYGDMISDTAAVNVIKSIPSADVRENIHAYWIVTDTVCNNRMFREFKCSSCEGLVYDTNLGIKEHKFCLRCGAIMDGEPKGEKGTE